MRRTVTAASLVSLLTGCASTTTIAQHPVVPSPAQVARAKELVSKDLKDPASAQFRDLFAFRYEGQDDLTVVCGQLNAKNSYGGYSGFSYFFTKLSPDNQPLFMVVDEPGDTRAKYVCTGNR